MILIGGGIIMLFAHNWDDLSRLQKTVMGFLPLLAGQGIYGYAFFRQRNSIGWSESASSFLMLMLLCTLSIISQVYNLGGSLRDLLLAWIVMSIPLLYLMNVTMPCIFFLAGAGYWGSDVFSLYRQQPVQDVFIFWGLMAAAVPHLWKNISSASASIRGNILGWTMAIVLVSVQEKFFCLVLIRVYT